MLPFLTFLSTYKTLIMWSAIVLFALGVFGYVKYQSSEIKTLQTNNATLQTSLEEQNKTIEQLKKDHAAIEASKELYQEKIKELNKKAQKLKDDLYKDKTNPIEEKVNADLKRINRCLELESGDSLDANEKIDCTDLEG